MMTKVCRSLSLIAQYFTALALVLMTVIVIAQVFGRYVLNTSPVWAEQAALLLLIWCVFIAAAAGVREGFHIRISVVIELFPPDVYRFVESVVNVVVAVFGIAMIIYGAELAEATRSHVIPTLGVTRSLAYIPIIISGSLVALFSIERQFTEVGTEEEQLWS